VYFERATILYADLHGSTALVDAQPWTFAAEIYKAYLRCAARIIQLEGGAIPSYDGDRVMGVFIGGQQSTTAVRCGLKINWAVRNIVQPGLNSQYPGRGYKVVHTVGIDASEIRVARTGVRGDNDLVFVGRAANYAAKLTELNTGYPTYITKAVYDWMMDQAKLGGNPSRNMWEARLWTPMDNHPIYRSSWSWSL
jgi:class 3 adenylate cyclase